MRAGTREYVWNGAQRMLRLRRGAAVLALLAAWLAMPVITRAAVPDSIPWGSVVSLPGESEIRAYRGTQRAPYVCCEPVFSKMRTYTEFSVDFRADHLPKGTYLCVNNWDFDDSGLRKRYESVKRDYNGVAGYAGFQRHYDGTTWIIMTVWDTRCYDRKGNMTRIQARQTYPKNNEGFEVCRGDTDTGEGCFVHTLLRYDWREGRNYRALLQLTNPSDGTNSHLLFYVCDLQTGAWTQLVEYDLGYNGAYMNRCVSFLEDFSANDAGRPRSMVLANYRVRPTGKTAWQGAKQASLYCYYSNDGSYQFGAKGNAFWTVTTGIPRCFKAPNKRQKFTVKSCESGSPY